MKRLLFIILSCSAMLIAAGSIPTYTDPQVDVYFKDWLICGPFPNPLPAGMTVHRFDSTSLGFYRDYLTDQGGETRIKPVSGMIVKHPDGRRLSWRSFHGYFPLIPLDELFTPNSNVVAYAACKVISHQTRPLVLSITSNDGVRVWHNGQLILDHNCGGTEEPDRDLIPIVLQKGENSFLVKTAQGSGKWSFQFRLLDLVQTAKQLESRLFLFIRPEISETNKSWEIFLGDRWKVGLLASPMPATVQVIAPDQKHILATFNSAIGKTLTIKKDSLQLAPGLYQIICRILDHQGYAQTQAVELYVGQPPTLKQAQAVFKTIPEPADSTFLSQQIRHISHCLDFQQVEGLEGGNERAMDSWNQTDLCNKYRIWRNNLKTAASPYHQIIPLPKEIRLTGDKPFVATTQIILVDSSLNACAADIERLRADVVGKTTFVTGSSASTPHIVLRLDKDKELATEAYMFTVRENRITVTAAEPTGLHNGLITLRHLLLCNSNLPAADILDYPSQAHRCAFQFWSVPMTAADKQRLLEYIDLKYNEIVVYSGGFFNLDDPALRDGLQEYFRFLRSHYVEPIPTVWLNPEIGELEGVALVDEAVRFVNDTCRFDFQYLVNRESSRPSLHAQPGGGRTFSEGQDYRIISQQPPVLLRLAGGRIAKNEQVYMNADLVDMRTHRFAKACPSEESVYLKFSKDVARVVQLFHPQKIHVNHDEIGVVNSDSRCRKRGLADVELIALQINRMRDIIKSVDAHIDMIMWADEVNPYHNSGKKYLEGACDLLHRDIIMAHWYYDAENYEQVDLLQLGTKFFLDRGFRVYGCPWDDLANHKAWECILGQYGQNPQMLGLMNTHWGDRGEGITQTGISCWEEKSWVRK
jgi:hypothetical protein